MNKLFSDSEFIFFTTREFAFKTQTSITAASHQLRRLHGRGDIERVTRGLWCNPSHPYFTAMGAVPYLLGQEQGYVSFLTALHRHGVLSQIPKTIQIATTGHSRVLVSPIGSFEFFQIKPAMMKAGINWSDNPHCPYRLASAEKALLDTLYISTRKSRRFVALPEIELADPEFDQAFFKKLLATQISSLRIKNAVAEKYNALKNAIG